VLGLILLALYTLPFVWFITRTDRYDRVPGTLALMGFLWGGLVATWVIAVPGNGAMLSIYAKLFGNDFATSWGPPLTAPFVEESAKYCGLILLFLLARSHVRSAYDGMILGAFVGLGFQVFENFSYIIEGVAANFGSRPVQDTLQMFIIRGLSGLWSHAAYTAIAGAGLGYFIGATDRSLGRRLAVAAAFFVATMVVHGALDAVLAIGVLGLPINVVGTTVAIIIAWRLADRRQRQWVRVLLVDEVDRGTVTNTELDVLAGSRKERNQYLKSLRQRSGKAAARREGHVLDAQIDLAAALAATDDPAGPEAEAARNEVRRVRALPAT
jgi:RsiW-degrading membrane proteinase PrsW (M82 family)